MVPLKFLRKRSSRFGATCWGITTPQANRADGLCKYCKGLPHPLPMLACESLYPNMWHQILNFFFLNISMASLFFQYNFYFIYMRFLDGVPRANSMYVAINIPNLATFLIACFERISCFSCAMEQICIDTD